MTRISKIMLRFLHYGPLLASGIIILVTIMTILSIIFSTPITSFRYPNGHTSFKHHPTLAAFANMTIFLCFSILTTYHFLVCMILGPGFVKKQWRPEEKASEAKLQYCEECEGYKCPRSHHCRQCQRCVKKMDHHCPWINCCVGYLNQAHFIRFLFYSCLGCFYGGVNLAAVIIKMILYGNANFILHYYFSGVSRFVILIFSCGISFGVSIAVGFLLVMQLRDVSKNTTNIESWIIRKAEWRNEAQGTKFVYPYDLGSCWANFTQVINTTNYTLGDGYSWPVVNGTDQYSFTKEQILQKQFKRDRMVPHKIVTDYTARWFSRLTLRNPMLFCVCSGLDDKYLDVVRGDLVLVSRYRKRWLYACIKRTVLNKSGNMVSKEIGGWFPRICAMETVQNEKKNT